MKTNNPTRAVAALLLAAAALAACETSGDATVETAAPTEAAAPTESAEAGPQVQTGNGVNNYIVLDGAVRDGATFTFAKVAIDRPGWLVMHPFKDGAPVPTVYVGATLLPAGVSENVSITIDAEPASGDMFVTMLHYDMDQDGVFDFDGTMTPPDAAVFENGVLVALRYEVE